MVKLKEIIEDVGKYHYLLVAGNKSLLLSSNNNKKDAKDKALKKIGPKIDKLKDKIIYEVKLKTISKKKLAEDKKATIPKLGGPIVAIISKYVIKSKNKLENKGESGNNHIYFTKKFLKKNKLIDTKYIRKITYAYDKKITNILFAINTVETILKALS